MTKELKELYELTVTYILRTDDDTFSNTFVIGLFKKESELLRVMRIIRSNNCSCQLCFNCRVITNPYYITNIIEDKNKIF